MTIKLTLVAGARPNFMKIAPLIREIERHSDISYRLVHTGQHYDKGMSDVFFDELGIPKPDISLGAGGGSHAEQTGKIMLGFEKELLQNPPNWVIVVGDVNSTLACSIAAKKLHIKVAHVEAGLRSGDRTMPEEINRLVTDSISDLFFVTEPSGGVNLLTEGKSPEVVRHVGHVMIDNLFHQVKKLEALEEKPPISSKILEIIGGRKFGVVTLHRPVNVDHPETLSQIIEALAKVSETMPLVFPVHPRTKNSLANYSIKLPKTIIETGPLPYMEFLHLWSQSAVVITDSGGLQEESTALMIPCVTVRDSTERPITLTEGTNRLANPDCEGLLSSIDSALKMNINNRRPELWDGRASERIVDLIAQITANA